MAQLGANELEDKCKMGNKKEFNAFVKTIPLRFDVGLFVIRKVYKL